MLIFVDPIGRSLRIPKPDMFWKHFVSIYDLPHTNLNHQIDMSPSLFIQNRSFIYKIYVNYNGLDKPNLTENKRILCF